MFIEGNSYKYATEGTIIMYLHTYDIIQQQDFEIFEKIRSIRANSPNYNIYMVMKRPKISINPNFLDVDKEFIKLEFFVQNRDKKESRKVAINNNFGTTDISIETEYPYNYFKLKVPYNNFIFKSNHILDEVQKLYPIKDDLLDFEVLYIGQSFGENGSRDAIERLKSHSTLQKIYSEAMINNPDFDIWILLCDFRQISLTSINGMIKTNTSDETEVERLNNFLKGKFTYKQKINFTEAALIKTFKPPYNEKYKNTFPNPNHSSYSECYKLDINGIVIELDLSEIKRWIFSAAKPRQKSNYWQVEEHEFTNNNERYNLFFNEYL
ncbi:hypothetical protein PG338_009445 [Riemerella anatipestifer]|uniref:hypothetical protein n=1 Tax=Riemerella anatipestifer TaxID=34085 RepID=UPI002966D792|nr:hypothetical protein [Riemerella anatipestifer]MDW3555511.1 hypothetical protein [Riemerella anatipestifer]